MAYDLIVIGGGPGGYAAALDAAEHGLSTALVEKDRLGGTCLQRGCVPTKTYLHDAREGADRKAMLARKNEIVNTLTDGIAKRIKAGKVELLAGNGTLMSDAAPFRVRVTAQDGSNREAEGERVLLATGSVPARPPVPGCADPGVWTSDDLLGDAGAEAFSSLLIVGGGVIGVEMACIYRRLGVKVTILEAEKSCLPMLDRELSRSVEALLRGMGVELWTGARLEGLARVESGFAAVVLKDGRHELTFERVLLATGRRPATEGLLGPGVEVAMERGAIVVNECFQTSLANVYAIGDVNGRHQLAHAAHAQGLAAVAHMLGMEAPVDPSLTPSCVYTSPEVACVGMTQDEARARGVEVSIGKALTTQNARTLIEGLGRGFVKLVLDKHSGVLLGAQLFCGRATDMIGELTLAIEHRLTGRQLLRAMRAHPTFYEAVTEAAEQALKRTV